MHRPETTLRRPPPDVARLVGDDRHETVPLFAGALPGLLQLVELIPG